MAELRDWFCHSHHGFAFRTWEERERKRKGSMIPFAGAGRHLYLQATIYLWMKDCGAFTRGKEMLMRVKFYCVCHMSYVQLYMVFCFQLYLQSVS